MTRIRIREASLTARVWAWVILGLLGLGLTVHHVFPQISRLLLERPATCSMKTLTGVACIGCRGTRSAFAFANGNLVQAFLFNPLIAVLAISVTVWAVVVVVSRKNLDWRLSRPGVRLFWIVAVAIAIGSWIFVICAERVSYNPEPWPIYR